MTPVPYGAQKIKKLIKVNGLYLYCENILHGQDVHFEVDAKGCFDLCSDKVGSADLCKFVDLASWREDALESHAARGASGAEEHF